MLIIGPDVADFRLPIVDLVSGQFLGVSSIGPIRPIGPISDANTRPPNRQLAIGNWQSSEIGSAREQLSQDKGENSAMLVVVNLDRRIYSQGHKHLLERTATPVNQQGQIL